MNAGVIEDLRREIEGSLRRWGNVALARSDHEGARARFEEALLLCQRIPEPYSIGQAHRRLARDEQERRRRVQAARAAWSSIGRPDLVAELDGEFPS